MSCSRLSHLRARRLARVGSLGYSLGSCHLQRCAGCSGKLNERSLLTLVARFLSTQENVLPGGAYHEKITPSSHPPGKSSEHDQVFKYLSTEGHDIPSFSSGEGNKYFLQSNISSLLKVDRTTETIVDRLIEETAASADRLAASREILRALRGGGSVFSAKKYVDIFYALCERGEGEVAQGVLEDMATVGVRPSDSEYEKILSTMESPGELRRVYRVWNQLRKHCDPLPVDLNVSLSKAFDKSGDYKKAERTIVEMMSANMDICPLILSRIIINLAESGHVRLANKLHAIAAANTKEIDHLGERTLVMYSSLITANAKFGSIDVVSSIWGHIAGSDVKPDVVLYTALLNAYQDNGKIDVAMQLIKEAKGNFSALDLVFYSSALHILGSNGELKSAIKVFDDLIEAGLNPNVHTYTSLMDIWLKAGGVSNALGIMEDMKAKGLLPNVVTTTILMTMWDREGRIDKVRECYEAAIEKGSKIVPDLTFFAAVIRIFCRRKDLETVQSVLDEMAKRQMMAETSIHNQVLRLYGTTGNLASMERHFNEMKNLHMFLSQGHLHSSTFSEVRPLLDHVSYAIMIDSWADAREIRKAKACFEEYRRLCTVGKDELGDGGRAMGSRTHLDHTVVYTAMMRAYALHKDTQNAWKTFLLMDLEEIPSTIRTFNILLKLCAQTKNLQLALRTYDMMRKRNLQPDRVTFNTLVMCCASTGNVDVGRTIMTLMREEKISPDSATYCAELALYGRAYSRSRVEAAWRKICRLNSRASEQGGLPVELHRSYIAALCRVRDTSRALTIFHDMIGKGPEPDQLTYKTLLKYLSSKKKLISQIHTVLRVASEQGVDLEKDAEVVTQLERVRQRWGPKAHEEALQGPGQVKNDGSGTYRAFSSPKNVKNDLRSQSTSAEGPDSSQGTLGSV